MIKDNSYKYKSCMSMRDIDVDICIISKKTTRFSSPNAKKIRGNFQQLRKASLMNPISRIKRKIGAKPSLCLLVYKVCIAKVAISYVKLLLQVNEIPLSEWHIEKKQSYKIDLKEHMCYMHTGVKLIKSKCLLKVKE